MNYIIGLLIATASLLMAMHHLNQGPDQFWDFVAFSIVWGGTFAVSIIIMPLSRYKIIFSYFKKLIFTSKPNYKELLEVCMNQMSQHKKGETPQPVSSELFHFQILNEGFELIHLGMNTEKVKTILQERIHFYSESRHQFANSIKSLAKYPPAFGLTGTVFGLVELMKGVSQGMPAKETGLKMAIALVATLYGLLVANLIINPAGEHLKKIIHSETQMAELALQAILLASQQASLLEAQELMNSQVMFEDRVNILSQNSVFEGAA